VPVSPPPLDHWPRHGELGGLLRDWVQARPELIEVETIGRSHEGRDIWLCTVTANGTRPASEKPAVWIDANIHATEVTGGAAALDLIHHLIDRHGSDPDVTRALETRTFYVVPRLNPDGVERVLADRPEYPRSGVRPWPLPDPQPGLHISDVDGDGRILFMRISDETGHWTTHPDEQRLLVPRPPTDDSGQGYRLLTEGHLVDYDGDVIKVAPALAGLDFNRNFPQDWRPEQEQQGAGPFPTSEPEIRAAVQAIVDRPNITQGVSYHTFSAVHLRPYASRPDEDMLPEDLRIYNRIGAEATALTGYPTVSIYHHFLYEPKTYTRGGFDDWLYDHLGILGWTTEFWSAMRAAGVDIEMRFIDWWKDHPIEDDLRMLAWSDRELGGAGFIDWYPFEHPQLGPVEIGGWDFMNAIANAPLALLRQEIAPHSTLAVRLALMSPLLEVRRLEAEPLGDDLHRIVLVVQNRGWLGTSVTEKAKERKVVRPVEALIEPGEGARLRSGEPRVELGQLEGRPRSMSMLGWDAGAEPSGARARCEWVVEGPTGARVGVTARHARAGTVRGEVTLGA
jgi:zinc carboxypeptidase